MFQDFDFDFNVKVDGYISCKVLLDGYVSVKVIF